MTLMITNADGSQSEVYTKEEVTAAETKATEVATTAATAAAEKTLEGKIEEYKKANPSGAEEIETLKNTITEKEGKITELEKGEGEGDGGNGGEGDSEQIKRIKEEQKVAKEELEGKLSKMGETIAQVTGDAKAELIGKVVSGASESEIEAAGGKEEFQKKIEVKYDSFQGDAISRTQIEERVGEAVTLVTGTPPTPELMDGATAPASKGEQDHAAGQPKEVSEISKKVGAGLGISEEDRKTFGSGGDKDKSKGNL